MSRILIADDSSDTLNILNWSLQRKGYDCSTAYYKAGLFYTLSKTAPSLIILDVNFNGEDGRLICREIKAHPGTKNIPVILFSGTHELLHNFREYLADAFIPKPFELQMMLNKIESLLAQDCSSSNNFPCRHVYCLLNSMKRYPKAIFFIGTSNIVVPGNRQSYPPAYQGKSRLHYYSSFFNSLEINSSFYKTPMQATFSKWSLDVPKDFRFTVKLSKEITHSKELDAGTGLIGDFLNAANGLSDKKGCFLIQFPGKITMDYYSKVEKILEKIRKYDPQHEWRIAVEFRSATWYVGETIELMDEYAAALVLHDIAKGRNVNIHKKAPFVYIRFHGPAGDYRGSYDITVLKTYAQQIKQLLKEGKDVYCYFNNTIGSAFENARTLQGLVQSYDSEL